MSGTGRTAARARLTLDRVSELRVIRAGTVPYQDAWEWQRRLHAERVAGTGPDTLLLLEHPPVYTAGKRTLPADRPFDGTPVIEVDRGGKITWHGPGQLVGYPIVALPDPVDVVAHVRRMEQALMTVCTTFGVGTTQVEGRSGVWVRADEPGQGHRPDRKVAAIGVRVARGVTMHGFALNCDPDMTAFSNMVPCGIPDAGATSLTAELGRDVPVSEVIDSVEAAMRQVLTPAQAVPA
jgi:lipoyl(octanoyl) transferase